MVVGIFAVYSKNLIYVAFLFFSLGELFMQHAMDYYYYSSLFPTKFYFWGLFPTKMNKVSV